MLVEHSNVIIPHAFDAPLGGPVVIYRSDLVRKKLEWCGYPIVKKFENVFTLFDTIHDRNKHQTDGRTDTAQWHRPRLCIASRGKN